MLIRTTISWVKKKKVEIEEDLFEPIDIVEEVMGNDKNAVCVMNSSPEMTIRHP